jgi:hypothetical protein
MQQTNAILFLLKLFDMKKIVLAAIIITLAFIACKKSQTEEPASVPTAVGLWKGNVNTSVTLALNLKADNTINVYNNLDTAATLPNGRGAGTWTKTNSIVNVTYKFTQQANVTYTGALTANDALNSMSGDINASGTLFGRAVLTK